MFETYYYAIKMISMFSEDKDGLVKLGENGWKQVLEGIQIKEIVKKDIQEIYQGLVNKIKSKWIE